MEKLTLMSFAMTVAFCGCVDRVSVAERECPCAEGWHCCAATQKCVESATDCETKTEPPLKIPESDLALGTTWKSSVITIVTDEEVEAEGGWGLQGGRVKIAWTGERYALLFEENVSGHIFVKLRFVDAEGKLLPGKYVVSEDYDDIKGSPHNPMMMWSGEELGIFWTNEGGQIMYRRVGPDGAMLSSAMVAIDNVAAHASLSNITFDDGAYTLVWSDDRAKEYHYRPYFARVSPEGKLVGEQHQITKPTGPDEWPHSGPLLATKDGYAWIWEEGRAGANDSLYFSKLDAEGHPRDEPVEVYNAATASSTTLLQNGTQGYLLVVSDYYDGIILLMLDDSGTVLRRTALGDPDAEGALAQRAGDGTLALAAVSGEYKKTNPLETTVSFFLVDQNSGKHGPKLVINPNAAKAGSCLESTTMVRSGDTFGVVWGEGCDAGRKIKFALVQSKE